MRGIGLVAATILLTGCGREGAADETGTNVNSPPIEELNQAAALEQPVSAPDRPDANVAADRGSGSVGPCLMQGSERLRADPIRATGTEPFWSARVEGRCVTYSTPEDQQGVRVWTQYSAAPNGGGTWTGQLGGKKFEMRTRAEAGCSDGMSDKSYPIAVELTVNGEQRKGCAEPL